MNKIKEENYITILAPMVTELGLKGNELIIFALIYGFSQSEDQCFTGSLQYLSDWTNLSRPSVIKCLQSLIDKGYINKHEIYKNNVKFCAYDTNYSDLLKGSKETLPPVKNLNRGSKETLPGGSKETLPNIDNNIYNIDIYNNTPLTEKPDTEKVRHGKNTTPNNAKTLFRNSKVYDLVEFSAGGSPDYSKLEAKFSGAEFENVDVVYYFHCVADWSDQKDVKRTANGWMATIRNFIRRDMENNKLHKKVNDDFDFEGAMAYLKMNQ